MENVLDTLVLFNKNVQLQLHVDLQRDGGAGLNHEMRLVLLSIGEHAKLELVSVKLVSTLEVGSGQESGGLQLALGHVLDTVWHVVVVTSLIRTVGVVVENILSQLVLPGLDAMHTLLTDTLKVQRSADVSGENLKSFLGSQLAGGEQTVRGSAQFAAFSGESISGVSVVPRANNKELKLNKHYK